MPLAIGGLLVLAGASLAVWRMSASGEAPTSASFGYQDWLVRCQSAESGCRLSQQILDKGSRQALLQLHLGRAAKGEGHELVVVMPLGVSVAPGISIEVGKTKRHVAFTQCLPGGCLAPATIDAAFIETLKSESGGRVAVVDRAGKTIAVPFSLKGFAPAFDKMEQRGGVGANDATWTDDFWNPSETK